MRTVRKGIEWVGTGLVVVVVLAAAFMFIGPRFGWDTHPVLSGSMEPALGVGGVIITRPVKLTDVKVGDIITFKPGDQRVTHRVVEIVYRDPDRKPWFKTKGDANDSPDGNLASSNGDVIAKTVFFVPYLGYLSNLAKNKQSLLLLMGVPALIFIGLICREIWRGILDEKNKRNKGLHTT